MTQKHTEKKIQSSRTIYLTNKHKRNATEISSLSMIKSRASCKALHQIQHKLSNRRELRAGVRNFNKTLFGKLSKNITEKPISFYKFGLRENEKNICQEVFCDIFKISKQKIRKTFVVNELWQDRVLYRYLKQNQMFLNKRALVSQFKMIDKQTKINKKEMFLKNQAKFVSKFKQWNAKNEELFNRSTFCQENKARNSKQACLNIRREIEKMQFSRPHQQATKSRQLLQNLQSYSGKFQQLSTTFNKLIMTI